MHVSELKPTIEAAIAKGAMVKILLITPRGSDAMSMAARRAGHETPDELEHELSSNLIKLRLIADHLSQQADRPTLARLEVRQLDYLPPYTLYAYDPHSLSGRMEIRLGGLSVVHDKRPGFTLTPRDGVWYQHFKDQFNAAWDSTAANVAVLSGSAPSTATGATPNDG
jgi:hypothetical protein